MTKKLSYFLDFEFKVKEEKQNLKQNQNLKKKK